SEVLRTEQLRKLFGGLVAVNDVEFAVEEGEIVGLIGPNGAGKTTFFNLVSGAMRVSSGRIFFQGREITHAPAYQRAELGIGRTFQIMKPFPRLTVMENLLVGAYLRHPNRHAAVRWAAEVIEMMGLAEFASASARSLTTAGRTRLDVARSLTLSPTDLARHREHIPDHETIPAPHRHGEPPGGCVLAAPQPPCGCAVGC